MNNNIVTLLPSVTPAAMFDMMHIYKAISGVTYINGRPCLRTVPKQSSQGKVKIPARKGQLKGLASNPVKAET